MCGLEFKSNKKKAVLCVQCWKDEGYIAPTSSEYGRCGSRPVDTNGMIEDDYSEASGRT